MKNSKKIFLILILNAFILPICCSITCSDENNYGIILSSERSIDTQKVVDYFSDVFESDWAQGESYDKDEDGKGYAQSRDRKGSGYEPYDAKQITDDVKVTPILSPDNSEDEIIDLIESATSTLDIEQMYIYDTLTDIVDAIIDEHNDGVTVRVILEDTPNANSKVTADALTAAGISVRICTGTVPMYFDTQHNKGVIVDGKKVLISSINWSPTSLRENREAGVIIESDKIADYYQELFEHDWSVCEDYDNLVHLQSASQSFSTMESLIIESSTIKPTNYSPEFSETKTIDGEMIITAMASPDNCYSIIADLLQKAETSIDISVYTLSSPYLLDILADRINMGVKVRLLLEKYQVSTSEKNYNRWTMYNLTYLGIYGKKAEGLWASDDFKFQHCKYCIIDGGILILSSGNWGRSSCPKPQDDGDVDGNRDWWIIFHGTPTGNITLLLIIIGVISVIALVGIGIIIKLKSD